MQIIQQWAASEHVFERARCEMDVILWLTILNLESFWPLARVLAPASLHRPGCSVATPPALPQLEIKIQETRQRGVWKTFAFLILYSLSLPSGRSWILDSWSFGSFYLLLTLALQRMALTFWLWLLPHLRYVRREFREFSPPTYRQTYGCIYL